MSPQCGRVADLDQKLYGYCDVRANRTHLIPLRLHVTPRMTELVHVAPHFWQSESTGAPYLLVTVAPLTVICLATGR